jgi:hypothetical protein
VTHYISVKIRPGFFVNTVRIRTVCGVYCLAVLENASILKINQENRMCDTGVAINFETRVKEFFRWKM